MTANAEIKRQCQETNTKISAWEQENGSLATIEPAAKKKKTKTHSYEDKSNAKMTTSEQVSTFVKTVTEAKLLDVEVDDDLFHLCAEASVAIYDNPSKAEFQTSLKASTIGEKFPDLHVHFFQNGITVGRDVPESISLNPPTFASIFVGSTLILCWRGSTTIKDWLIDLKIKSTKPFDAENSDLEVHAAMYDVFKEKYKANFLFIEKYVKGDYNLRGDFKKDGVPITKILLTGHSLGGGLANIAHLCLTIPSEDWKSLVETCEDKKVIIKTLAFSAPMTTIVDTVVDGDTAVNDIKKEKMEKMKKLLNDKIFPNVYNIYFLGDVVPRAYSHLEYLNDFVNGLLIRNSSLNCVARSIVQVIKAFAEDHNLLEQALKYSHIGQLIELKGPTNATPTTCDDKGGGAKYTNPATYNNNFFRKVRFAEYEVSSETVLTHHVFWELY